jgi:predicted TIM-barrel enzyme
MPQFLAELKAMGFSGVQNFPTIGLFDGTMRQSFEETGMGYGLEVDMIAAAHELDLLTTPYVFNPDEAIAMTKAGADIIVAHMGVTTGGTIGASSAKSLDQCGTEIDAIASAARGVRQDVIILCHGGPIAMPDDARYILERCDRIHGFYGASSMERLPAEAAIREQTAGFKALPLRKNTYTFSQGGIQHADECEGTVLCLPAGRRRFRVRLGTACADGRAGSQQRATLFRRRGRPAERPGPRPT